jgi:hypothetical protein
MTRHSRHGTRRQLIRLARDDEFRAHVGNALVAAANATASLAAGYAVSPRAALIMRPVVRRDIEQALAELRQARRRLPRRHAQRRTVVTLALPAAVAVGVLVTRARAH